MFLTTTARSQTAPTQSRTPSQKRKNQTFQSPIISSAMTVGLTRVKTQSFLTNTSIRCSLLQEKGRFNSSAAASVQPLSAHTSPCTAAQRSIRQSFTPLQTRVLSLSAPFSPAMLFLTAKPLRSTAMTTSKTARPTARTTFPAALLPSAIS